MSQSRFQRKTTRESVSTAAGIAAERVARRARATERASVAARRLSGVVRARRTARKP